MDLIYILEQVPYHDNNTIVGIYTNEDAGLAALKAAPNPDDINCDDFWLTEWNVPLNKEVRSWWMRGEQVNEPAPGRPWNPVRKEFTFHGPVVRE